MLSNLEKNVKFAHFRFFSVGGYQILQKCGAGSFHVFFKSEGMMLSNLEKCGVCSFSRFFKLEGRDAIKRGLRPL